MRSPDMNLVEALSRIRLQMSQQEKCQLADVVIDNSNGWERTAMQLNALVESWKRKRWLHYGYFVFFYICMWVILYYIYLLISSFLK